MCKMAIRFVVLLAAVSLRPMCALASECDVADADGCGRIKHAPHYQRLERPTGSDQAAFARIADKDPIVHGCITDLRSMRCDQTTDLIHTPRGLLERAAMVMGDGLSHRQFRLDLKPKPASSSSPRTTQLVDNVRYHPPGRQGRLYDRDTTGSTESWANLAYRFNRDIGSTSIRLSLPDALLGSFQEIRPRYPLFRAQLLDNDGHNKWFMPHATDSVPQPGRLATLIAGLFGMYAMARRRISSI